MKGRIRGQLTRTRDQINPPGKQLEGNSLGGEEVVLPRPAKGQQSYK